jgi:hypothetical protein
LGQKKPVSVFRLVTENTIEQKIVERAQQKLKLDAMVVQQGRLKEKDKLSKEEIMAAVRFGADTVFRSEESTITDEDIDVILERGKAKTKELADKIQKAEKGDILDFRLDGGISAQTYDFVAVYISTFGIIVCSPILMLLFNLPVRRYRLQRQRPSGPSANVGGTVSWEARASASSHKL